MYRLWEHPFFFIFIEHKTLMILPGFVATLASFGRSSLPLTFSPDLELESSFYL